MQKSRKKNIDMSLEKTLCVKLFSFQTLHQKYFSSSNIYQNQVKFRTHHLYSVFHNTQKITITSIYIAKLD